MDVQHDVTDDDRKPENVAAAHASRQAKEDAETIRVRGPQRPADNVPAPQAEPTAAASAEPPKAAPKEPRKASAVSAYRRQPQSEPVEHVAAPAPSDEAKADESK